MGTPWVRQKRGLPTDNRGVARCMVGLPWAVLFLGTNPMSCQMPTDMESCHFTDITFPFLFADGNMTQDTGSDEVLRRLAIFTDLVRKHSAAKKIRSEHTWWPLSSKPAKHFRKFPSSVLLCDQLGVSETDLAKALDCNSVTEKRLMQCTGESFLTCDGCLRDGSCCMW